MRKTQKPRKAPSKELKYLGECISTARTDSGLTQQELADQISRGLRHIQNFEAGLVNPSYEMLSDIIHRLGMSADSLFFSDIAKLEEDNRHLLNKFAACTEEERQFLLKTVDCMVEQFIRRRHEEPEQEKPE